MSQLTITLKNNSEREQVTKNLLQKILTKYDLNQWIICTDIVIEEDVGGKAFPMIRLSAWKDNEEGLIAQFLHEQFHWIENGKEEQMRSAINELKVTFPNSPIEKPLGGGSEKSTYCHLIVCRLELLALTKILGGEKSKRIVSTNNNYTWIRKMVIERGKEIDLIINKYFPESLQF